MARSGHANRAWLSRPVTWIRDRVRERTFVDGLDKIAIVVISTKIKDPPPTPKLPRRTPIRRLGPEGWNGQIGPSTVPCHVDPGSRSGKAHSRKEFRKRPAWRVRQTFGFSHPPICLAGLRSGVSGPKGAFRLAAFSGPAARKCHFLALRKPSEQTVKLPLGRYTESH